MILDLHKGEIFLTCIIAGKVGSEDDYKHLENVNKIPPKYGRNWWYDVPKFRKTTTGWEVIFLCFMLSYDNYLKLRN